jgi:hypothetical protein
MAKARAMRIDAQLPEDLWPEAIKTAAYVTNRSPSKALNGKLHSKHLNKHLVF